MPGAPASIFHSRRVLLRLSPASARAVASGATGSATKRCRLTKVQFLHVGSQHTDFLWCLDCAGSGMLLYVKPVTYGHSAFVGLSIESALFTRRDFFVV